MCLREVTYHVVLNAQGVCGAGANLLGLWVWRLNAHSHPTEDVPFQARRLSERHF